MSGTKGVLLDLDGTLAAFNGDFCELLFFVFGIHDREIQKTIHLDLLNAWAERVGRVGPCNLVDLIVSGEALLNQLGVQRNRRDSISELCAAFKSAYIPFVKVFPEVLQSLEKLSGLFPIALVSNGPSDLQREVVSAIGLTPYLKFVVISGDSRIGVAKPSKRIFQHAAQLLALDPAETAMIGDDYIKDIIGAREAGCKAIHVKVPTNPKNQGSFPSIVQTLIGHEHG